MSGLEKDELRECMGNSYRAILKGDFKANHMKKKKPSAKHKQAFIRKENQTQSSINN